MTPEDKGGAGGTVAQYTLQVLKPAQNISGILVHRNIPRNKAFQTRVILLPVRSGLPLEHMPPNCQAEPLTLERKKKRLCRRTVAVLRSCSPCLPTRNRSRWKTSFSCQQLPFKFRQVDVWETRRQAIQRPQSATRRKRVARQKQKNKKKTAMHAHPPLHTCRATRLE